MRNVRIGEAAARAGVSARTLRYYEDLGLVPEPDRNASGYREYPSGVEERLSFIRAAQAVGLTLGEIREVIAFRDQGEPPCAWVLELIERRRSEVDDRIGELQRLSEDLDRLAQRARTLSPADCPPERVCHLISIDRGRGQ